MRYTIILAALALIIGGLLFQRRFSRGLFDAPVQVQEVDLGVSPGVTPEAHDRMTCRYYPDFMIKEVVTSEKGAEISIVPSVVGSAAECRRENAAGEIVISQDVWSGYVDGVKSGYLFLRGDDSFGLLYGFAVFDARTGKKLFEDDRHVERPFERIDVSGLSLTMKYTRAVPLDCSLLRAASHDGTACWDKARRELGLHAPMPDCAASYQKEAPTFPEDPSQLAYEVEAVWDGSQFRVTPVGASATCAAAP